VDSTPTDQVQVWLVPATASPAGLAHCRSLLDESERARAATLAHDRDRDRFTVAHGAFRLLIGRLLDVDPATLAFVAGPHGKPALLGPESLPHTNLSHSGDLILVAVSPVRPVGVDIQDLAAGIDPVALSARFFPPDEAAFVAAGHDAREQQDRFTHLWCRKEAAVKAAGGRLWSNLRAPVRDRDLVDCLEPARVHRVVDLPAPPGFRAAVALDGPDPFTVSMSTVDNLGTAG
jgi:4'-phosphopantetheinyl transferase